MSGLNNNQELCLAILDILAKDKPDYITLGILSVIMPNWIKEALPGLTWSLKTSWSNLVAKKINLDNSKSYFIGQNHDYTGIGTSRYEGQDVYPKKLECMRDLQKWLYYNEYLPNLVHTKAPPRPTKYNPEL